MLIRRTKIAATQTHCHGLCPISLTGQWAGSRRSRTPRLLRTPRGWKSCAAAGRPLPWACGMSRDACMHCTYVYVHSYGDGLDHNAKMDSVARAAAVAMDEEKAMLNVVTPAMVHRTCHHVEWRSPRRVEVTTSTVCGEMLE
eukprot:5069423-Prymnesium_polylepis.1